jgi:transposase-like protein
VRDVALLVAVGVSDEGYREVLAVEAAAGERSETWRGLLQGLVERGLRGVRLAVSDDHDAIKQAVKVELPGAAWQRCVVHFERNVLAHVPQVEAKAVAADLKGVFQAARRETAEQLAASFAERYREPYPKAVAVLSRGLDEALTYTAFPSSHHRLIRTTNGLERVFREVKRRTRVVGVFPNEESAETLATAVLLRVSEDWAERRYLDMAPLHALFHEPTRFAT